MRNFDQTNIVSIVNEMSRMSKPESVSRSDPRKLRVFIADDHTLVRASLRAVIGSEPDLEVVGEAADGAAACELVLKLKPDLVVMDIQMSAVDGIEATRRLKRELPNLRVLALTGFDTHGNVNAIIEAGADGCLTKTAPMEEMFYAIRTVAAGHFYLESELADKVLKRDASDSPPISEREETVLRLHARGYANKEIAAQLGVSVKTVETYKARATEKLGLHSRVQVIRYADMRGWLRDAD